MRDCHCTRSEGVSNGSEIGFNYPCGTTRVHFADDKRQLRSAMGDSTTAPNDFVSGAESWVSHFEDWSRAVNDRSACDRDSSAATNADIEANALRDSSGRTAGQSGSTSDQGGNENHSSRQPSQFLATTRRRGITAADPYFALVDMILVKGEESQSGCTISWKTNSHCRCTSCSSLPILFQLYTKTQPTAWFC